ncbi:MAG: DUF4258 domain-containing protein [Candidatus Riflebacteria bacterium]|nr:DUF4258 domain-containing protein [Candidatus Riflebacteria bacterium]
MKVCFYMDPETGEPHIFKHGITEDEVYSLLENPKEDQACRGGARIARGMADSGRFLRVVYAKHQNEIVVITGWVMAGNELKAYRRRNRNR